MRLPSARLSTILVFLIACTPDTPTTPSAVGPSLAISDGAHGSGNEHFFFLPPMVPPPSFAGTFDPTLQPAVIITGPGVFQLHLVPAVSLADQAYQVNWRTGESNLEPGSEYRISVKVEGTELGFADVKVGSTMSELKNVNTGEYIPLKDGRTLPIKFRIEQGWRPSRPRGWSEEAELLVPRQAFGAAAVGGRVFAVGGWDGTVVVNSVEAYDPGHREWSLRAAMPTPRMGLGVGEVNGILYAIGGQTTQDIGTTTTVVEAYDPVTNSWSARAPMPTPRSFLTVSVVDGLIFAIGGQFDSHELDVVEAYSPTTDTWEARAPMPSPRKDLSSAPLQGSIYVAGGMIGVSPWVESALERYDPASDAWDELPPMPTARWGLGVGALAGRLYVVGGIGPTSPLHPHDVDVWDPSASLWTISDPIPTARRNHQVVVVDGVLFVIGGANSNFAPPTLGSVATFVP